MSSEASIRRRLWIADQLCAPELTGLLLAVRIDEIQDFIGQYSTVSEEENGTPPAVIALSALVRHPDRLRVSTDELLAYARGVADAVGVPRLPHHPHRAADAPPIRRNE